MKANSLPYRTPKQLVRLCDRDARRCSLIWRGPSAPLTGRVRAAHRAARRTRSARRRDRKAGLAALGSIGKRVSLHVAPTLLVCRPASMPGPVSKSASCRFQLAGRDDATTTICPSECRLVPLRPQGARRKRASAERPSPEGPFPAATFKMLPKAACAGRLIGAAFSLKHA